MDWRVVDIPGQASRSLERSSSSAHILGTRRARGARGCSKSRLPSAVEHLVALGHRRIGLLSATASTDTYRDHKAGFIEALDGHGIRVGRELVSAVQSVFDEDRTRRR